MTSPKMDILPVLLAGGSGTRLWPLSRKSYPKQFLSSLLEGESLFQAAARRFVRPGFLPPLIMTGPDFRFIVTEQLATADLPAGDVLIEPSGRNTAPAILAAALWCRRNRPDTMMLVTPSDHAVADPEAFVKAVENGLEAAESGQMVTFGIAPTHPETGYGYIELSKKAAPETGAVAARRFVEKPDRARAEEMLAAGNFLWNAGIFLFTAETVIEAFETHAPDMIPPVQAAIDGTVPDLDFFRLDPQGWSAVADISFDHAIMEQAANVSVVPFPGAWSDLGNWDAIGREMGADDSGNAMRGNVTAINCESSLLRSEDPAMELVGLGLENLVVVATRDAVLVADQDQVQDVRQAVARLQQKEIPQAQEFPWDHRPWGHFETLALGPRFQVKRIVVKPGGVLSLQSHMHRAEHWVVVEGTAEVTIGDEVRLVSENQSVYVPLGEVHRMSNPGKVPMVLIEVQTGSYLGEDDITRYEDVYDRGAGAKG